MISRAGAGLAEDERRGREIRPRDDLDELLDRDRRVFDIGDAGADDLAQIVRRDVRGHADRDAAGAVDEEVREARGEHGGLHARTVVIGREVAVSLSRSSRRVAATRARRASV
jgi:hypothetical protein